MSKNAQLGIGSWTFPYHCGLGNTMSEALSVQNPMSPWELIQKAQEYHVNWVQICENRPLDVYTEEELKAIRNFAQERGIGLEVGMRGATLENLNRMLQITYTLGARLLRCVIDMEGYEPSIEEIIWNLESTLPVLEKYNIVLGVENHDRFKAREFAYIMERLQNKHYGIVLDTTNSLAQEESVEEVLDALARYTVCLHFKDYTIVRSPGSIGLEITGTPVGRGRQKVEMILKRLCEEAQSDFSTIIEFWMPGEENLRKTLDKEEEWAGISVSYLKEVIRKQMLEVYKTC